jgi:hypothetical protein
MSTLPFEYVLLDLSAVEDLGTDSSSLVAGWTSLDDHRSAFATLGIAASRAIFLVPDCPC